MYEECRHIKTSGTRCGSPALKGRAYCYFHFRAHQQRHRAAGPYAGFVAHKFDVAVLEDRASIQLAISEVVAAMANNQMDHKRGGKILYGLQLALNGMKHQPEIVAPEPVRELCQNDEGEDIATEMTVYEDGEAFPDDDGEEESKDEAETSGSGKKEDTEDKADPGREGSAPRISACADTADSQARPQAKTLREAIAHYIAELKRRNPNAGRYRNP